MRQWSFVGAAMVLATFAQARVWTVGAGAGSNFGDLPQAVAAAAPGDTLLLRNGFYQGARISRSLHLIPATWPPNIALNSSLLIEDLPAGERVLIKSLAAGSCTVGLEIRRCAGVVQIEGIGWNWGCLTSNSPPGVRPALHVSDSTAVVLNRCGFAGTRTSTGSFFPAIEILRSQVWLYEVSAYGGTGAICVGQTGGLAMHVEQSRVTLSDCSITGGQGSGGIDCTRPGSCVFGSGGAALDAPGSRIFDWNSRIEGGLRGSWTYCALNPQIRDGRVWMRPALEYSRQPEALPQILPITNLRLGSLNWLYVRSHSPRPVIVFVSFAAARLDLPPLVGPIWIDPFVAFHVATTGPYQQQFLIRFPVENEPLAHGFPLHFQVIDVAGLCGSVTSDVLVL